MAPGVDTRGDVFSAAFSKTAFADFTGTEYKDDGYCRTGNAGNGCSDSGRQAAGRRQFLYC